MTKPKFECSLLQQAAHEALDRRIEAARRRLKRSATEQDIVRNEEAIDALEAAIFAAVKEEAPK